MSGIAQHGEEEEPTARVETSAAALRDGTENSSPSPSVLLRTPLAFDSRPMRRDATRSTIHTHDGAGLFGEFHETDTVIRGRIRLLGLKRHGPARHSSYTPPS